MFLSGAYSHCEGVFLVGAQRAIRQASPRESWRRRTSPPAVIQVTQAGRAVWEAEGGEGGEGSTTASRDPENGGSYKTGFLSRVRGEAILSYSTFTIAFMSISIWKS